MEVLRDIVDGVTTLGGEDNLYHRIITRLVHLAIPNASTSYKTYWNSNQTNASCITF